MTRDERTRLPWFTLVLIAVLLGLTPYAMAFDPFQGSSGSGTHEAQREADALRAQRVGLVVLGLGATAFACLEGLVILRRRAGLPSILSWVAAWFACAVLGWRSFPYWVTGAYAVRSGRVPFTDLDPKGLIPMTWLGEVWRLGVLALYPCTPLVLTAAVLASLSFVRRRAYVQSTTPLLCAAVGLVFLFCFSPGFLGWLMD